MLKHLVALVASLVVPFFIFLLVISLNESDLALEKIDDKQVNFNVQKQKQIKQARPKKKPKPKRSQQTAQLPSMKPSGLGSSLSGSGLSFGIPQFDEARFSDINEDSLLDSVAGKAMDKETVDTIPRVLRRSPLVYPELARKLGISGYVTMNVLINTSGQVEDVEIVDAKPEDIFDLKAENTIRRWRFEPATYNGKKVKVWALQKITFKLD
ncbi:MAG TPA: energy transducer TonB [Gammaproteobacteria bacterium]|nr:energy transducer TonB [Gammaproteobacteria bacterium]